MLHIQLRAEPSSRHARHVPSLPQGLVKKGQLRTLRGSAVAAEEGQVMLSLEPKLFSPAFCGLFWTCRPASPLCLWRSDSMPLCLPVSLLFGLWTFNLTVIPLRNYTTATSGPLNMLLLFPSLPIITYSSLFQFNVTFSGHLTCPLLATPLSPITGLADVQWSSPPVQSGSSLVCAQKKTGAQFTQQRRVSFLLISLADLKWHQRPQKCLVC